MIWRALGVAVVLLGLGVVGGYAVAERSAEEPVVRGDPSPVAARSPDVPTPPAVTLSADPDSPPLATGVPLRPESLRTSKNKGYALDLDVPDGWIRNRQDGSDTWNYVPEGALDWTYKLRVGIVYGQHQSTRVARAARISAYEDTAANGEISDFQVTERTTDGYTATYVQEGHLRVTSEQWVSFNGGSAYAVAAVTGRTTDTAGLDDLLARVTASMAEGDSTAP